MYDKSNSLDIELQRLNPDQRAAVLHGNGPALVLSGAGSGKTRVLILRIARLIEEGVPPWKIRAVTFTKKAAGEMRERLAPLVGADRARRVRVSTFHSWGLSLLRRHAEAWGLSGDFAVYDPRDSKGVLRRVDKRCSNDAEHLAAAYDAIMAWKSEGLLAAGVSGPYAPAYQGYETALLSHNAVDFADLICIPWHLLSREELVRRDVRSDIEYLMVDEYQDTSPAQFALTQWALDERSNIFAVGDEDQAIYGWRGADIRNILDFREKFPGAVELRLEQNYRSRPEILHAANQLVSHNKERLGKVMRPTRDPAKGSAMVYRASWPSQPSYDFSVGTREVVSMIGQVLRARKVRPEDVAVLVRTNRQLDELSRSLQLAGVPVQVLGSRSYWEFVELQAAMSVLRVLVRPTDNMAWAALFKRLKVGVGPKTTQDLLALSRDSDLSVWEVMAKSMYTGRSRLAVQRVYDCVDSIREANPEAPVEALWRVLWDRLNGPTLLTTERRQERILQFLQQLRAIEGPWPEAADFLDRIATSESGAGDEKRDAVTLSTIHRSKGLEWPLVFCSGWASGVFPAERAGEDQMEEERRLAYVALTRAQEQVIVVAPEDGGRSCFVGESGL